MELTQEILKDYRIGLNIFGKDLIKLINDFEKSDIDLNNLTDHEYNQLEAFLTKKIDIETLIKFVRNTQIKSIKQSDYSLTKNKESLVYINKFLTRNSFKHIVIIVKEMNQHKLKYSESEKHTKINKPNIFKILWLMLKKKFK